MPSMQSHNIFLLCVLLMIPLRRAFIVKQHGKLKYPEGTACAEVLVAGEKGGSSARTYQKLEPVPDRGGPAKWDWPISGDPALMGA